MKKIAYTLLISLYISAFSAHSQIIVSNRPSEKIIEFGNKKMKLTVDYNSKCVVTNMHVNGEDVTTPEGLFCSIKMGEDTFSTLALKSSPKLNVSKNKLIFSQLVYGNEKMPVDETWTFTVSDSDIDLCIDRKISKTFAVSEVGFPSMNFKNINTWDGAFLDFGGLAWFYLFNTKHCTYGVHSAKSTFWNSTTGNGLRVAASATGKQIVSKFSRTETDALEYKVTVSTEAMKYKYDEGTQRRRYKADRSDIWAPTTLSAGQYTENIKFSWLNYNEEYKRGTFVGIDGKTVSDLLNTIARIGVIDKNHFGGNSWHTPYGPICLHEQYIAQMGIGINDPDYMNGDKDCLDFYRDNAVNSDGRVMPRWAYTNEDAMSGTVNSKGFYEAQWGNLMDSNPDFVINVADLYQQCGDINWVRKHKTSCEKVLEYMLKRDTNSNHLVEMLNDNSSERKSSDWIDIIWASFENAFVNAEMYHALILWADIEKQLGDDSKANYYLDYASALKKSFNKSTKDGGFWDEKNKWYVYWRDKDNSVHGNNLVTPVNFMAISYGLCDDSVRQKAILDKIEVQMQQEKLFAWPLCMYPFQPAEGNDWQFPFPEYENGDIFLSWGSIGVDAYAKYKPELALKYIENVLSQYKKDGLAFQRYQRNGQAGAGDDILSGNSLSAVGLYRSIYGINPMYNRLYLDPHLPTKLNGSNLFYNFRGEKLNVDFQDKSYSVCNKQFKITTTSSFGFNAKENVLEYFNLSNNNWNLQSQVKKGTDLAIEIMKWSQQECIWKQLVNKKNSINYTVSQLEIGKEYSIFVDGKIFKKMKSDRTGKLNFSTDSGNCTVRVQVI